MICDMMAMVNDRSHQTYLPAGSPSRDAVRADITACALKKCESSNPPHSECCNGVICERVCMMKAMLIRLLVLAALLLTVPTAALAGAGYHYVDENGKTRTTEELTVTPVTADTDTLTSGWYVVNSDVTRDGTIAVSGSVHLILVDGYTLSVMGNSSKAGIAVSNGNSLAVYGQEAGTGTLATQGGQYGAGIGGTYWALGGTINVYGGTILATGGQYGAGIGGGHNANAGTTTITGGTVTATGGENSAGIGGGNSNVSNVEYGIGGTVVITGGTVIANGNGYGAGIGGGLRGQSGEISISGGVVHATSGDLTVASGGAGIGGGAGRGVNKVTISGGTVIATALDYGAGIGGGSSGSGGTIEITGGEVTASSRYGGAGIGGGHMAGGGTTTISGGIVSATSEYGGAGIGGGYLASSGTIHIHGGQVTAYGGSWGAGIGGGGSGSCNAVTITDGIVHAIGDYNAGSSPGGAGIGSGGANAGGTQSGGTIQILGGRVTAQCASSSSSVHALDIGKGRNGINGSVLIDDGAIVSLGSMGMDASVTTLGTCILQGAGAGSVLGAYEDGIKIDGTLIDVSNPSLSSGAGYTVSGDAVTLMGGGSSYVLFGNTTSRKIVASSGASVPVALFATQITPASGCAFHMTGATVNLRLVLENTVSSGDGFAGIQAAAGSSLTIYGTGSLTAIGGSNGSGIGGGSGMPAGSISFTGGTVEAVGNGGGAGVGGGSSGAGGVVLAGGADTTLSAKGGATGYDIGSGAGNSTGGSLAVQHSATVNLLRNGTNANASITAGMIGGEGAGLLAGTYLDSQKLLTFSNLSASPTSNVKAFDTVTLTATVTGLSTTDPEGQISFYCDGAMIGQAPLARAGTGSADATAQLNWTAQGGSHTFTALYRQNETADSYCMTQEGELDAYDVAKVDQAALNITGVPETVTYGDAPFALVVTGGSGTGIGLGFEVTAGEAVSVDADGTIKVEKAGAATVTVTKAGDSNYHPKSGSVTITVKKAVPLSVGFPSASSITYGQPLSDSALTGGSGDGTFAWENPDTKPTVHNTGYAVWFTPNDAENYDYTGVTLSQTVPILVYKALPAVTFPTAGELTYEQSLAHSALTGGSGEGSFAWETPDTIPTVVNSGYRVLFTPHDTDNYLTVTQTVAVLVRKADQLPLSIAEPSVTYGDAPFSLSVSGGSGTGSLSYAVTAGDAVSIDALSGLLTVKKAGSATVTVTQAADSNYNETSVSAAITVGKATPTAVFPTAASITYGQPLSSSVLTGGSGDGTFAWKSPDAVPPVINSGFAVVFTPSDPENYVTVEQTLELVVIQAAQTPLTVSGLPDRLTFGDAPFRLTVDGGSGTGTLSYAVTSGESVAVDAAGKVTIVHAGAAVLSVTRLGDDNYLPVSCTFHLTVNKAAQATDLTFDLPESIAYGDAPFQINGSGGSGKGAFGYSVASGDAVAVSGTGVVMVRKPGVAIITATKAGDVDYLSQTMKLGLSVKKGTQNTLTIAGIPASVHQGRAPFRLVVSGGSGTGALSYRVASGNAVSVDENGVVTIRKKGTALLTVTKAEDAYYLAATATAKISVRKAASTLATTPPASPTPSARPTATTVLGPTVTAAARPSATDSPVSVRLRPLSVEYDEKTGELVVGIRREDLLEGVTALRLPSGEIIEVDTAPNSLKLTVSREAIDEAGDLVLVALDAEHNPMARHLVHLSEDAWKDGAAHNGKTAFGSLPVWIAAGVLALAAAVASMRIVRGKKTKE